MKTVIMWDWDNTLADTFGVIHRAQNELMAMYGRPPLTNEQTMDIISRGSRTEFFKVFGKQADEAFKVYWKLYEKYATRVRLIKGAEDLLEWTKQKGCLSVLVSNKIGTVLRKECKTIGLTKYFKSIVGAGDVDDIKPSVLMVRKALEGLAYDQLIMVGDGVSDIEMAHRAKAVMIFVRKERPTPDMLDKGRVDFDCQDLKQVKEVLSSLIT